VARGLAGPGRTLAQRLDFTPGSGSPEGIGSGTDQAYGASVGAPGPRARRFYASHPENRMNWTHIESKWEQLKAEAKSTWGKLTDDDLAYVSGKRDKLVGKLQERYGVLKENAQKDVDKWVDTVSARLDGIGKSKSS
jgi:uncharacterized protein YjbJ (UPF0337 family)